MNIWFKLALIPVGLIVVVFQILSLLYVLDKVEHAMKFWILGDDWKDKHSRFYSKHRSLKRES